MHAHNVLASASDGCYEAWQSLNNHPVVSDPYVKHKIVTPKMEKPSNLTVLIQNGNRNIKSSIPVWLF